MYVLLHYISAMLQRAKYRNSEEEKKDAELRSVGTPSRARCAFNRRAAERSEVPIY